MDYGAVVGGYHSDMTRTVAVGSVSEEQKKIYNTVLEAQLAAMEKMAPGVSCADADKAARDIITDAGYGEFFGHGTGRVTESALRFTSSRAYRPARKRFSPPDILSPRSPASICPDFSESE